MTARDDDPRDRPPDPAGTQPRVDPASLVPAAHEPLLTIRVHPVGLPRGEDRDEALLPPGPIAASPLRATAAAPTPHRARFQFLAGGLIALALACVAGIVVFAVSGSGDDDAAKGPAVAWSAWQPTASNVSALTQIAGHVGPLYERAGGAQLTLATGGPLEISGLGVGGGPLPLQLVLHSTPSLTNYVPVGGVAVAYHLCGLGSACRVKGTPTAERGMLVRREALELALYTFHYVQGVDNVVVYMPPTFTAAQAKTTGTSGATAPATPAPATGAGVLPTGTATSTDAATNAATAKAGTQSVIAFAAGDLAPMLSLPLDDTITGPQLRHPTAAKGPTPTVLPIDQLAQSHLFSYAYEQSNSDNAAYMVLSPPAS